MEEFLNLDLEPITWGMENEAEEESEAEELEEVCA